MQTAPIPNNEVERLAAVKGLNILDTPPEPRFDQLTAEAIAKLQVPISTISIIDDKREWFKSCQGVTAREGGRAVSFCGHAMLATQLFMVEDTLLDPRFKDNPMVTGRPFIRFYAGVALLDRRTGLPVGVFCVKDTKPRQMSPAEVAILMDLAERAEAEINRPQRSELVDI